MDRDIKKHDERIDNVLKSGAMYRENIRMETAVSERWPGIFVD